MKLIFKNIGNVYLLFTPYKKKSCKILITNMFIIYIVTPEGFEPSSSEPKSDILIH